MQYFDISENRCLCGRDQDCICGIIIKLKDYSYDNIFPTLLDQLENKLISYNFKCFKNYFEGQSFLLVKNTIELGKFCESKTKFIENIISDFENEIKDNIKFEGFCGDLCQD